MNYGHEYDVRNRKMNAAAMASGGGGGGDKEGDPGVGLV